MSSIKPKAGFNFYLSCDVNIQVHAPRHHVQTHFFYINAREQVKIKVASLQGTLPSLRQHALEARESVQPSALFVEAKLTTPEETLGLETKTTYADSQPLGCTWDEWLTFCVKVNMFLVMRGPCSMLITPQHKPSTHCWSR